MDTEKIMPIKIKRYETSEEFRRLFKDFFHSICLQQNDPNFKPLFAQIEKLVQMNIPTKLYKYRPVKDYTIENLRNDTFACSKPIDFNDPFDSLLYFDIKGLEQFIEDTSRNTLIQIRNMKKEVSDSTEQHLSELKSRCRWLLSSMETSLQQHSYIGCLTESNDCPLMWGHYADSHKGFCLEYDLSCVPFWLENFSPSVNCHKHVYPVLYSNEKYCAKEFALQQASRIMGGSPPLGDTLMWFKAYTSKAINWEYEKEWRIIILKANIEDTEEKRYFLPLKPTAIYYGLKFNDPDEKEETEKYKTEIRELAKTKKLKEYKMTLKEEDSSYNITPELL